MSYTVVTVYGPNGNLARWKGPLVQAFPQGTRLEDGLNHLADLGYELVAAPAIYLREPDLNGNSYPELALILKNP